MYFVGSTTVSKIENIARDRLNVTDTRYNPIQRPDVPVDTEKILHGKIVASMLTGLPYTRTIVQVLAVEVYHKLLSFNLYDDNGQRKKSKC